MGKLPKMARGTIRASIFADGIFAGVSKMAGGGTKAPRMSIAAQIFNEKQRRQSMGTSSPFERMKRQLNFQSKFKGQQSKAGLSMEKGGASWKGASAKGSLWQAMSKAPRKV